MFPVPSRNSATSIDIGDNIANSLMFDSVSSQYLSRTPGIASNRKTWTWSGWVKRSALLTWTKSRCFGAGVAGTGNKSLVFGFAQESVNGDILAIQESTWTVSNDLLWTSTPVYRDPSGYYHVVIAMDTTQATAADRIKVYVNSSQITGTLTVAPAINYDTLINSASLHTLGAAPGISAITSLDGYLSNVHFIDGQALTPAAFGRTSAHTGQWVPKTYTGTYGTNGFKLGFTDATSTTTLGYDTSGNANHWNLNAMTTANQYTDTPTNNFCTLNPLKKWTDGSSAVYSLGNTKITQGGNPSQTVGTFPLINNSYVEVTAVSLDPVRAYVGVVEVSSLLTSYSNTVSVLYSADGTKAVNAVLTAYGATYTNGDVIGVWYKNGKVYFSKNNVWQNSANLTAETGFAASGYSAYDMVFYLGHASNFTVNFGQRPFTYTPPTGFKTLCTANLSVPTIKKPTQYFVANTRTGTGAAYSVTGKLFSPGLVWVKGRSGATDHAIYDAVRGVQNDLASNSTAAETVQATGLTAFNSDGYTGGALAKMNTNAATYVDWLWKESASSGMDIVTYTGNGANRTIAHSLGAVPKMVIVKQLSAGTTNWLVWHIGLTSGAYYIPLNLTSVEGNDASVWNSTVPTSSVFSVGTNVYSNANGSTYVAYLFSEIAGFSKFGSYTGNGLADGPFVHCGFRPAFVMVKRTDVAQDWYVWDIARDTYNESNKTLDPNLANAEEALSRPIDFISNGFKNRVATAQNVSGGIYIYMAFAEAPFKYARAR